MAESEQKEADAGRKIVFSYGFVRDSDMDVKEMYQLIPVNLQFNHFHAC